MNVKYELMSQADVKRTLDRLASEIVEGNPVHSELVMVGIRTRGGPLAERLARRVGTLTSQAPEVGYVDIAFHRDDFSMIGEKPVVKGTELPFDIRGRTVILVDDVLYTGRTVRAAIEELMDYGRPKAVRLCILVDRGDRELPICPDYVGKVFQAGLAETVDVKVREIDGADSVVVLEERAQK
jgi:pyrimidine operon attenuation protein/uracil phosphoribosyltransferase